MSDEELEAIAYLRRVRDKNLFLFCNDIRIVLNLITKQQKDLETYKKIAEKLALKYADYLMDYEGRTGEKNHLIPTTAEKLLDWARKEVENEEIQKSN